MFSNFQSSFTAPDFQVFISWKWFFFFFLFVVHLIVSPSSRELLLQYSNVRNLSKRILQKQGNIPAAYFRVNFRYCDILMPKILVFGYSKVIQIVKCNKIPSPVTEKDKWLLSNIQKACVLNEELNKTSPK